MKTILNVRLPLFAALGVVVGIILVVSIVYGQWLVAVLVPTVLGLLIFFACQKKWLKLFWACLTVLICLLLGLAVSAISFFAFQNKQIGTQEGTLCGYATDDAYRSDYFLAITLSDCTFENQQGQIYRLNSVNLSLMLYDFLDADGNLTFEYRAGSYFEVVGTISDTFMFKDTIEVYNYKQNVFQQFSEVTSISSQGGNPTFDQAARQYIKHTLTANMALRSDIAFALLVGDKSLMNDSDLASFRDGGIAHLLAVSGLHVGFLGVVFGFVLEKIKAPKVVRLFVVLVPLIFYAYICGFAPSVVRAVIMTALTLTYRCLNIKGDLLNSLSVAAVAILLFRPFLLFDVGFLLSFFAIFGIATVAVRTRRFLQNRKIPSFAKKTIQTVSISAGTAISTFPLVVIFFGRVSLVGIFSNLIAVPLVTVAYIFSFVGLVPFLNFVLIVPDILYSLLRSFSQAVGGLPFSAVDILTFGIAAAVALYCLLFAVGGFVNLKKKAKRIACVALAVVATATFSVGLVPTDCQFEVYIADGYSDCLIVVCDNQNTVYVIGNIESQYDIEAIDRYLAAKRVKEVHLFVYNFYKVNLENITALSNTYNLSKVYILDSTGNDAVERQLKQTSFVRIPPNNFTNAYVQIGSVYDGALVAIVVKMPQLSFAISLTNKVVPAKNLQYTLPADLAYLYCVNWVEQIAYQFSHIPVVAKRQYQANNIYALSRYGNFTIAKLSDILDKRQNI